MMTPATQDRRHHPDRNPDRAERRGALPACRSRVHVRPDPAPVRGVRRRGARPRAHPVAPPARPRERPQHGAPERTASPSARGRGPAHPEPGRAVPGVRRRVPRRGARHRLPPPRDEPGGRPLPAQVHGGPGGRPLVPPGHPGPPARRHPRPRHAPDPGASSRRWTCRGSPRCSGRGAPWRREPESEGTQKRWFINYM